MGGDDDDEPAAAPYLMIAVSRRAGIFTVDPNGSGEHVVARGKPVGWLLDSRHLLANQAEALVNIDVRDGTVDVIERRKGGTWSISPDGKSIAYDVFRDPPGPRECWFDIYSARVNGDSKRRLTTGGRSSNPVWGPDWIAFAYRPQGTGCFAPRVWKMRPDGSEKQPIMQQLPRRFSSSYYGVRPFSWVRDRALLLATIPTEWGNELALVNSSNGSTRKPNLDPRPHNTTPMYWHHPPSTAFTSLGQHAARNGPARSRSTRWPTIGPKTSSRERRRGQTGIAEGSSGGSGTIDLQLRERGPNGRFGPGHREEPGPLCIRGR
jgi:hypothetical protein